jgi:hypothetical protein
MIHSLRCEPRYMDRIQDGTKTFEVRRNDRNFQVGDVLNLGDDFRMFSARIMYVFSGDPDLPDGGGLQPGYVVLGLEAR